MAAKKTKRKKALPKREQVMPSLRVPPKSEVYYVGIEDPQDIRKEILNAAKGIISSLRKYEQIKENRRQKIILTSKLTQLIKEIKLLFSKLKTLMPETKIRHLPIHRPHPTAATTKTKKTVKIVNKKVIKVKKANTELEKLENELRMIESKLTTI